jgi:putative alpha-1,2-mannosidase
VPILPITGAVGSSPGSDDESFSHSNETASPGYYSVALGNGTSVALTTTTHAGVGQFTFPASTSASLLLKLDDPQTPYVASTLSAVGSDELTGSVTSSGFCEATNDFTVYFAIEFDQDFSAEGTYGDTSAGPGGAYVSFGTPAAPTTVTARVGISYTSSAEAQANLQAEVANASFAQVEAAAQADWTTALDKVEIAGGTAAEQATFYTALYHAELFPSVISDARTARTGASTAACTPLMQGT